MDFAPDREIVSVGDSIVVQLGVTATGQPLSGFSYTYSFWNTARYIPGSVSIDGLSVPDGDPRVTVFADSVRIALASTPSNTTTITLRVRAIGSIGKPVLHDAALTATGFGQQALHGYPTWIEDEVATLLVPQLLQDTYISQAESGYNFGANTSVQLRVSSSRRGVLQFDIGSIAPLLPANASVVAAYLELWPSTSAGGDVTLNAYRLRQNWTEGTSTGGPCVDGATWLTRNCVAGWTGGGDYDASSMGSAVVGPSTSFAFLDIQPLVQQWITSGKPNQGLLLVPSSSTSNQTVTFASREGNSDTAPSARLVVVIAPDNTYATKAVKDAKAEICPTIVITNVPSQRFVYTLKPSFEASSTGMNRASITIPPTFTYRQVDTVTVAGSTLRRTVDATLSAGEYEVWNLSPTIDVRFAPRIDGAATDDHVVIVFHAGTPALADGAGREFLSTVDDDRRGYPQQAAAKGNANDIAGDGNTWLVKTNAANIVRVDVLPATANVSAGHSVSYTATARYGDGSSADVTAFATWTVAPGTLGTFGPEPGVLNTRQPGIGSVSAGFNGVFSVPSNLTVGPAALLQLWIQPTSVAIAAGRTAQFRAYGAYSTRDTLEVTNVATWSVGNSVIAQIEAPGLVRGGQPGFTTVGATLSGIDAPPASVDVGPPELVSIAVIPADTAIALGFALQLHAAGTYSDGSTEDISGVVSWEAAPMGLLDLDATGLATTLAQGAVTVRASLGPVTSAPATLTVTAPVLLSIAVTPADTSVALGYSMQLRARGTYSNGTTSDLTSSVIWQATPAGVVSIAANGSVTTVAQGIATIRASLGPVTSAPATLTVTAPALVSIAVTPADTSVALGYSMQLRARGTYSNGTTSDLTSSVIWQATPAGVVSIAANGSVTTVAQGTATIRASFGPVTSAPATLTVTAPVLLSIAVTPADTAVALGYSMQLRARGTYSNGTTSDLTSSVIWQATPAGVVSIAANGSVTTVAQGTATIRASLGPVTSAPATLTVTAPVLLSIAVTPADTAVALGYSMQLRARGTYSNGTTSDLTSSVIWQATPAGVVSIAANGSVTTVAQGTATIRASLGPVTSAPATLTVTAPVLLSIAVTPADTSVALGYSMQLRARGTYSNGTTSDLTSSVIWQATPAGVVSIAANGSVTTVAQGTATIRASLGTVKSGPARVKVTSPVLVSIAIVPADTSVALGASVQLRAYGTLSNGGTLLLGAGVLWSDVPSGIVSIDPSGRVSALAEGTASVQAALDGISSAPARLVVTPPALVSIAVTPNDTSVAIGTTIQFHARGTYTDGSSGDLTSSVSWEASPPGIVSIAPDGLAAGLGLGAANVRASLGSIIGASATCNVTAPVLASIAVTPADTALALGYSAQLHARGTYSDGSTTDLTSSVTWQAAPIGVVSIAANGRVTSLAMGTATIHATLGTVASTPTTCHVLAAELVALDGSPNAAAVPLGGTHSVRSLGTYSDGSIADLTTEVTWSSLAPTVADFVAAGTMQAYGTGTARLVHSLGTVIGDTLQLAVTTASLDSLRISPCPARVPPSISYPFTAMALFSDGSSLDVTQQAAWTSSDPAIAAVEHAGLIRTHTEGSTLLFAQVASVASPPCTLTVDRSAIDTLLVTPADTTVAFGTEGWFLARAVVGGPTYDVSAMASWSTSDPAVASVAAPGRIATLAVGEVQVQASMGTVLGAPSTLHVTAPTVAAIVLVPADTSIALGLSADLRARATYSDGSTGDVTGTVAWQIQPASVVAIDAVGHVSTLYSGTAIVHAVLGAVTSAGATFHVTPPVLVAIGVTPADTSLALGRTARLFARGAYSDGSARDLSSSVTWSATPPGIVSIDAIGNVSTLLQGVTTAEATLGSITSAVSTIQVTAAVLVAIELAPADTTLARGESAALATHGTFSDGSHGIVSGASWTATPDSVVAVDPTGHITALELGTATVQAALGAVTSGPAIVTVAPPRLVALTLAPADTTLPLGARGAWRVTGVFSDSTHSDYSDAVVWRSVPAGILELDPNGRGTALAQGSTTVWAELGTITSPVATVQVVAAALTAIAISPADTSVSLGDGALLRAQGTFTDGSSARVNGAVWSANPAGIIAIDAGGRVSTLASGVVSVRASSASVTSPAANFTVGPARLLALDGAPDAATAPAGTERTLTSMGHYSDGSVRDETEQVAWTSLEPTVASFTAPGRVAAHVPGTARLVHALGAVLGDTLRLQVTAPAVDSLVVTPCPLLVPPGVRVALNARAHYDNGTSHDVTAQADWSSDDPAVASIDTLGLVSARGNGSTVIRAAVGGSTSAGCTVTVDPACLGSISVSPPDTTVRLGDAVYYRALGDVGAQRFDLTAEVAWSAADTLVAHLGADGVAATRGVGTTAVHAVLGPVASLPARLGVGPAEVVALEVLPAASTLRLGRSKLLTARATLTDGTTLDLTHQARWLSNAPSVASVDSTARAWALALGTAQLTAAYGNRVSAPASLTILPAVQVEALATGVQQAPPGAADRLLLALRCTNRYTDVRQLTALKVSMHEPPPQVRLLLDDGDGVFEPLVDRQLAAGSPSSGAWTANDLGVDLLVGAPRTLFVAGDISLTGASQGDSLDAVVAGIEDLFWSSPTAVTATPGFPLNSFGCVRVSGIVRAQLAFAPTPSDTVLAGASGHVLLQFEIPDDGGSPDTLQQISVRQLGDARDRTDLLRLRLQTGDALWTDVAELAPTGGGQWIASGLDLAVPAGGAWVRVVADIATGAQNGRTMQLELPTFAIGCRSGRSGPLDASWVNPGTCVLQSQRILAVQSTPVAHRGVVARHARRLPVLGLALTVTADAPDSLQKLVITHTSTGSGGPAANPNLQLESAELWIDTDANGDVGAGDTRLDAVSPASGDSLRFGVVRALQLPLRPATPVRLLVTLTPDSTTVRDAERLAVRLARTSDVQTAGGLHVLLDGTFETLDAPIIDGQGASGYAARPVPARILPGGSPETVVLDVAIPANGFEDDVLQGIRIDNVGTATSTEVGTLRLRRDDGDGTLGAADALVASLVPSADRTWESTGLATQLRTADSRRFFVTMTVPSTTQSGRTFEARVPLGGVAVASGNDGPIDADLRGGGPAILTVANQVMWVAGVVGNHVVQPDVRKQPILVLETLNGYNQTRTLNGLLVTLRGTAAASEFDTWALYPDDNQNGSIDEVETPLAIASPVDGQVRFDGFSHALQPLRQQRLLVAYSLALASARDGSTIDAVIVNAAAFDFGTADGATLATAQFEMNSPGQDIVDGMVRRQVTSFPLASQTLGGDETDVPVLDLLVPSNGWEEDVLEALEVEFAPLSNEAVFGQDVAALRLWVESDADVRTAAFDPGRDQLLRTLISGATPLRFASLDLSLPVGGRRLYVTVDMAAHPVDGRALQMLVPIGGIEVASANDGPNDQEILGSATHSLSTSQILASVDASLSRASVQQAVPVRIAVRNRGTTPLQDVVLHALEVIPARPNTQHSAVVPASLSLAPGAVDTFACTFRIGAPGPVSLYAIAGLPDSSLLGPRAQSTVVNVERPPAAIDLAVLSNIPGSVNRGQSAVVPLIWKLSHPDIDSLAAPLSVRQLAFAVEDRAGAAQPASAVFDRLEVRAGSQLLAWLDPLPDSSLVRLPLAQPLLLQPGEERDLSLSVSIAANAAATSLRLRLVDAHAVEAVDANSGAPVALRGTIPWVTPVVTIHTLAPRVDIATANSLPATANRGQTDVSAGSLLVTLPGNPGESEARVTSLTLEVRAPDGTPVAPAQLFARFTVRSGGAQLLETTALDTIRGRLLLPLTIPKAVVSGAPEMLDLAFDVRDDTRVDSFALAVWSGADLQVLDATSGTSLMVQTAPPDTFPLHLGATQLQSRPSDATVTAVSRLPGTVQAGSSDLRVADLHLAHPGPDGTGNLELVSLAFRSVDAVGAGVVPRRAFTAARLWAGAQIIAATTAMPDSGAAVRLLPTTPLRLSAGNAIDLALVVDLSGSVPAPWLRFALDPTALQLRDGNEPTRTLVPSGTLPFATDLVHVVTQPAEVTLGVVAGPPANAPRGGREVPALTLRIGHPGDAGQGPLTPQQMVVLVRDARGSPLACTAALSAVHARAGDALFAATLTGDSLRIPLPGVAAVQPGDSLELQLEMDVASSPSATDLRFGVDAGCLVASGGSGVLSVVVVPGQTLPYLSPSVHLAAPDLGASFSNYPNPFAAGREATHITFYLEAGARVTIDIFTLTGERVVRLLDAVPLAPGLHDALQWDGRNGEGHPVRNGTYLLRLVADGSAGGKLLRKMAVLR